MKRLAIVASLTFVAAACDGRRAPTASTATPGQSPTAISSFTLSGVVFESTSSGRRPVSGVSVFADLTTGGYWASVGGKSTDAEGRYSFSLIYPGRLDLWATRQGYAQPCFTAIDLSGDAVVDIEIVSLATLALAEPPRLETIASPIWSGLIFERTTEGIRAIEGAQIGLEIGEGAGLWTFSNVNGRYLFCRVPAYTALNASKPGYSLVGLRVLDNGRDRVVDVELKRH
jgi:hypothetical protein